MTAFAEQAAPATRLRQDHEPLPLLEVSTCERGLVMNLVVLVCGQPRRRRTTAVRAIRPF